MRPDWELSPIRMRTMHHLPQILFDTLRPERPDCPVLIPSSFTKSRDRIISMDIYSQTHQYNTRQTDGYRHNMPKQTITSFSVKTQAPLIWNKCTHEIKDSKSLYTLKAKLRQNINTL